MFVYSCQTGIILLISCKLGPLLPDKHPHQVLCSAIISLEHLSSQELVLYEGVPCGTQALCVGSGAFLQLGELNIRTALIFGVPFFLTTAESLGIKLGVILSLLVF